MVNEKNDISGIIKRCIVEVIKGKGNDISVKGNDISVKESLNECNDDKKHIYNEFSLQHELGIKLRDELEGNYLVQFERNLLSFKNLPQNYKTMDKEKEVINKVEVRKDFKKSEIDILVVSKKNPNEKYAIELKYHRKEMGEVPDFLYNCVVDMWFVKRMAENGIIKKGFCVVVTEDDEIYKAGRNITENMRNNYIHFKDEDKTDVVKLDENKRENNTGSITKTDEKWKDVYNVVKKKTKSKDEKKKTKSEDEYYYINTREFYTEENTKMINWKQINDEAKYYIKEF